MTRCLYPYDDMLKRISFYRERMDITIHESSCYVNQPPRKQFTKLISILIEEIKQVFAALGKKKVGFYDQPPAPGPAHG